MKILAKSATIVHPGHEWHNKQKDVLIDKGVISRVADNISPEDKVTVIESNQLHLSTGWFDMRVDYADPGYEHREDLTSGATASAYGGYTGVGLLPDTNPPIDSKADIEYVIAQNQKHITRIHPYSAISKNRKGEELTEMIDMMRAGAKAFTDGNKILKSADLLKKSLLYSKAFNGLVMTHSEEHSLSDGQINEGVVNVQLGLTGIPAIAEEIAVVRNIEICRYTGGNLHLSKVSTGKALEHIRQAKKEGLNVSADVGIYHLLFDESALMDYEQNLKLSPPLRTSDDRDALRRGVLDGTIDVIVSDHLPVEDEKKKCEFQLASTGAIATQLVYPILLQVFSNEDFNSKVITALNQNPYNILGLEKPILKEGEKANLTLFDPTLNWSFDSKTNKSKSHNTVFWQKDLKGRAVAIANRGKVKILE